MIFGLLKVIFICKKNRIGFDVSLIGNKKFSRLFKAPGISMAFIC